MGGNGGASRRHPRASRRAAAGDPIGVLVVEDHRLVAQSLELILSAEPGMEPKGIAGSGEEALEICARGCPDVALVDIDLPGIDGIETIRRLRDLCPPTRAVVITALQPTELMAAAVEAGALGFLPKTRAAEQLVDVIRRAAAGEIVLPSEQVSAILMRLRAAREARDEGQRVLGKLTERERETLQAFAEGKSTQEVAKSLFISVHTVNSHVGGILSKLGVSSKLRAVLLALRHDLIKLPQNH